MNELRRNLRQTTTSSLTSSSKRIFSLYPLLISHDIPDQYCEISPCPQSYTQSLAVPFQPYRARDQASAERLPGDRRESLSALRSVLGQSPAVSPEAAANQDHGAYNFPALSSETDSHNSICTRSGSCHKRRYPEFLCSDSPFGSRYAAFFEKASRSLSPALTVSDSQPTRSRRRNNRRLCRRSG